MIKYCHWERIMKGIVKTTIKYVLGAMAAVGLITGTTISLTAGDRLKKVEEQKTSLLNKYRVTEEYKSALLSELDYLELGLKQGVITKEAFDEKADYLYTDEYVEKTIVKGESIVYQNQLAQLNEAKDNASKMSTSGCLFFVGGLASLAGAAFVAVNNKEKDIEIGD